MLKHNSHLKLLVCRFSCFRGLCFNVMTLKCIGDERSLWLEQVEGIQSHDHDSLIILGKRMFLCDNLVSLRWKLRDFFHRFAFPIYQTLLLYLPFLKFKDFEMMFHSFVLVPSIFFLQHDMFAPLQFPFDVRCRRLFLMGNLFSYFYDSASLSFVASLIIRFSKKMKICFSQKKSEMRKRKENFLMRKFSWEAASYVGVAHHFLPKRILPFFRLKKRNWKRCKDIFNADVASRCMYEIRHRVML